ncbi:flagellar hook-length control protein FliK [Solemya velesiana gill symbiont]|uniref:Flagellar hook-length control protein-like C-terminal domain-containing protein n=1 Tax=Solemya velesiana gill symbiont TaxID=1918948 RepID=A0A1T2KW76_9GAMM|nr:flagellar hook-length control protein FliK [Solemya velesiana gill symbiont]OOZ36996.1 hypothetical protein BOW51_04475 [Solemya velesiana gill symbiont]
MQISDLINNPRLYIEETRLRAIEDLRPGQTVKATVLAPTRDNVAKLQVGRLEVLVRTPIGLEKGQQLNINVVKAGSSPELSLLRESTLAELQARFFRAVLPKQQPLPAFFNKLRTILNTPVAPLPKDPIRPDNSGNLQRTLTGSNQPTPGPQLRADSTRAMPPFIQAWKGLATPSALIATLKQMLQSAQPARTFLQIVAQNATTPPTVERNQNQSPSLAATRQSDGRALTQKTGIPLAYRIAQAEGKPTQTVATGNTTTPPQTPSREISGNRTNPSSQAPPVAIKGNNAPAPSGIENGLPQNLLEALKRVLSHTIPNNEPITPERLREALQASGLFLESSLAQNVTPQSDFKASLLQLLLLLQRAPANAPTTSGTQQQPGTPQQPATAGAEGALGRFLAELLGHAESALARVQMHQLASVPVDDQPRQTWHLEVPVSNAGNTDSFKLRIARENHATDGDDETLWTVTLNFDLENLGPVKAVLTLTDDLISSHFVTQLPESARRIERELPKLDAAFERAGLRVGRVSARQGKTDDEEVNLQRFRQLLDEKA